MASRSQPPSATSAPSKRDTAHEPHYDVPLAQLQTLARRLAGLLRGIQELQELFFGHPTLEDWPTLSTRYASLLAQLHNISAALTSASPAFVASQQSALANELAKEARGDNLYDGIPVGSLVGTDTFQSGQVAIDGQEQGIHKVPALSALPKIHSFDPGSTLPALGVHPTQPIPDDEKTLTLHNALRTRFEPVHEMARDQAADNELYRIAEASTGRRGMASAAAAGVAQARGPATLAALDTAYGVASEGQLLTMVKRELDKHDTVAYTAQRIWAHLERAPDQWGERYDWKMRVTYDPDDELGGAGQEQGEEEGEEVEEEGEEEEEEEEELAGPAAEGQDGGDDDLFGSPDADADADADVDAEADAGEGMVRRGEQDGDEYVGDVFDESMEDAPNTPAP